MSINDYPRLCGGVFFTYLLYARKQRAGVREHYMGESDGLSDPEAFADLIRVIYPSYTVPAGKTFKENTSSYKNCRKSAGAHLPLNGTAEARAFDECVRTDYLAVLSRMFSFTDTYLDVETSAKKDEYLVEALIELISEDDTIESDAVFYALEDGTPVTKARLISLTEVCLQSFLIGIWHFVLINRTDNKVGRSTIENWKPSLNGMNRPKVYNHIVQTVSSKEDDEPATGNEEPIIHDTSEEETDGQQQNTTTQTVNNPVVFNQYGNNGIQIGSIGTLNINHKD